MTIPGAASAQGETCDPNTEHVVIANLRLAVFWLIHLAAFAAIWTGVRPGDLVLCAALYLIGMFAVTAGYHRYFSHRTYKLGRVSQFVLAWLAQSTAQKSVLWWAANHRHHHRHSDTERDLHSPKQRGFWYSHVGWILDEATDEANLDYVRDWQKYPEIVWLHRYELVPPIVLGVFVWAVGGWPSLIVGFVWSLVLLWHGTFTINSLSHVFGWRRYETRDTSRNNPLLALITLGEGWHNNHHHFMGSCRQGFRWWEVDITYYVIRVLGVLGIAREIVEPPAHIVHDRPHPNRALSAAAE